VEGSKYPAISAVVSYTDFAGRSKYVLDSEGVSASGPENRNISCATGDGYTRLATPHKFYTSGHPGRYEEYRAGKVKSERGKRSGEKESKERRRSSSKHRSQSPSRSTGQRGGTGCVIL
jgi:hypothetical protein